MKSRNYSHFIIVAFSIVLFGFSQTIAQTAAEVRPLSQTQKEFVETTIREYLLNHPSIIREAMQALQIKEEKEKQERAANNLNSAKKSLFSDSDTPTAGNPHGDVSIAVFFDYNCGHCKKSLPALKELLAKDSSLRIVYKELPILGPQSLLAARAALAAHRQGKYVEFHNALIESGEINDDAIKSIAERLGLNFATLQKDMNDPKISESLNNNFLLANALEINGTPAYIVGEQIIPGAIDSDSLSKIVSIERAKLVKVAAVNEQPETKK